MKVQTARKSLWISSKATKQSIGLIFDTKEDLESLMLFLDYSSRRLGGCKGGDIFYPRPDQDEKVLCFCLVTQIPPCKLSLIFIGCFMYHLKTPHKDVISKAAAQFFEK